ncbi:response regulator [Sinomicrobium sp. M5D2P9]
MIKIAITDDHPMITQGLYHLLSTENDLQVIASFSSGTQLLDWLSEKSVDVILLDIYLPDGNGLDLCHKISSLYPETRIIAISGQDEGIVVSQMLQNGALGYVLKNAESEEITEAIRAVFRGEKYLCTRTKTSLQKLENHPPEIPKITRREKEVLVLIAKGLTTLEVADKLFISPHTVESHRKNLMEKFERKSMTSVISTVKSLGLI